MLRVRNVAFTLGGAGANGPEYPGVALYNEDPLSAKVPEPFAIVPGYASSTTDIITRWKALRVINSGGMIVGDSFPAAPSLSQLRAMGVTIPVPAQIEKASK